MPGCVHHWKQDPNDLKAPFTCLRCGSIREFETNYFELMDKKESEHSLQRRKGLEQQTHPTVAIAHGEGVGPTGDIRFVHIPKVLVVDDEAITVLQIKQLLEGNLTCEVETALNGRQALEKAARLHPDLMLLDIRMPDMDGLEVCQRIKGNPLTAPSAVVYVSAYPNPEGELESAEAYLSKPLESSSLLNTVKALVSLDA